MTETDTISSERSLKMLTTLSRASFARLAHHITRELGIKMPESKYTMVQNRLLHRVRDLGMDSIERYAEYLFDAAHPEEREHFINAITTNKTEFFREPKHFVYLCEVVLPQMQRSARRRHKRFKVWSAGCSSGEEPYTLAMVLAEHAAVNPGFDFAILGTDISTRVLEQARNAIYAESATEPVPPELRRKYLLRSRNREERLARVVPELRRKVSLHSLNLMAEQYGIRDIFDVVFFRNVMIYFDQKTQEAVIRKISRNLARGGYLFIGHSESLAGLDIPVGQVGVAIYRKLD